MFSQTTKISKSLLVLATTLLLLPACDPIKKPPLGSGNGGNNGSGNNNGNDSGNINSLEASVRSAGLLGEGLPNKAELIVSAFFGEVQYSLVSAPAGMQVKLLPPADAAGASLLVLELAGEPQDSTPLQVKINALGKEATLTVPLYSFEKQDLPSGYNAAQLLLLQPSQLLISAQFRDYSYCCQIFSKTGSKLTTIKLPLVGDYPQLEYLRWMVASDSKLWLAARGVGKSVLLGYPRQFADPSKPEKRLELAGEMINEVVSLAGRLWYMPYNQKVLVEVNEQTGKITRHPMSNFYDKLTSASNGKLYGFSKSNSSQPKPSIVQIDPNTLQVKSFPLTATSSQPEVSAMRAAENGKLWYIEGRLFTLWQFDPATGQHRQYQLPVGAQPNQLAVNQAGQLWLADSRNKRLYRYQAAQQRFVGIAALKGSAINAMAVDTDGKVWYAQAGVVVKQK